MLSTRTTHYESPVVLKRTKLMLGKKLTKSVANVNKNGGRKIASRKSTKTDSQTTPKGCKSKKKVSSSTKEGKKAFSK